MRGYGIAAARFSDEVLGAVLSLTRRATVNSPDVGLSPYAARQPGHRPLRSVLMMCQHLQQVTGRERAVRATGQGRGCLQARKLEEHARLEIHLNTFARQLDGALLRRAQGVRPWREKQCLSVITRSKFRSRRGTA